MLQISSTSPKLMDETAENVSQPSHSYTNGDEFQDADPDGQKTPETNPT